MDEFEDLETLVFDGIKIDDTCFFNKIIKVFTNPSDSFKVIKEHAILWLYINIMYYNTCYIF